MDLKSETKTYEANNPKWKKVCHSAVGAVIVVDFFAFTHNAGPRFVGKRIEFETPSLYHTKSYIIKQSVECGKRRLWICWMFKKILFFYFSVAFSMRKENEAL